MNAARPIRPIAPPSLKPLKPKAKDAPAQPKAPKQRQCCQTLSGKDTPHAPGCKNHPDVIKERRALQNDSRLPDGATFTGTYNALEKTWDIKLTATIAGVPITFSGRGTNHDKLFHKLAQQCREQMNKPRLSA